MVNTTLLTNGLNKLLEYGNVIGISIYSQVNPSGVSGTLFYDDDFTYSKSGNTIWTSGLLFGINNKYGSEDSLLLEQGKLRTADKRLFIQANSNISGNILFGIGSPSTEFYKIIPIGKAIEGTAQDIYYKYYIRYNETGSAFE